MKKIILVVLFAVTLGTSSFSQFKPNKTTGTRTNYGEYYERGEIVKFYDQDGVEMFFQVSYHKSYGKHYRVDMSIRNLSGKSFLLDPSSFTATYLHKNKGVQPAEVLTYNEYSKKVKRHQMWTNIAVGVSEGMANYNAGYSTSSTNSTNYGYASGRSNTSGYIGSTYANLNTSSSTSGYSNTYSTTTSYNPTNAAYQRELSAQRMNDISDYQYEIRKTINEGYLRKHTVHNQTELIGYINIEYEKTDQLVLAVTVNGKSYIVDWSS